MCISRLLPHWDNRGLSVGVLPDPSCVGQALVWSKLPAVLMAASVVPSERDSIRSSLRIIQTKAQSYKCSKMHCILALPIANFKSRPLNYNASKTPWYTLVIWGTVSCAKLGFRMHGSRKKTFCIDNAKDHQRRCMVRKGLHFHPLHDLPSGLKIGWNHRPC